MKTEIEYHSNENYVTLHVDQNLVNDGDVWYTTEYGDKSKTLEVHPWMWDIYNISGVKSVSVRPYEISISKAKVFSWDVILPEAEAILQREYPENAVTSLDAGE